jgi:hypothetical protein
LAYTVTLIDRANRQAQIELSVKGATKFEDFYEFRVSRISLPIVRVPIGLPIYRMENFRTFSEQAEHIALAKKPADMFSAGQESESIQQLQHSILARMAMRGKSNAKSVSDVLAIEQQRESLLITVTGVVVNGNRRLAAMRELFDGDPKFQHFSHVDCKVLPGDLTPTDILEIEGALQAKQDVRLDYDWIGDAKLLDAMMSIKNDIDGVAKRLNRRPGEIRNALQAMQEANIYLKDWVGAEGEFSRVAEAEQFFKDLPTQLQGKPVALQEASRVLAWSLMENPGALEGRLYNYNVIFGKRASDVLDRLSEELGVETVEETAEEDEDFDFDIQGGSGEAAIPSPEPNYSPVINALKNPETRKEAVEVLVDISTSILESEKDKKSGSAALKSISAAHAKLVEVDVSRANAGTYDAMEKQLGSVLQRATQLLDSLKKLQQAASGNKQ